MEVRRISLFLVIVIATLLSANLALAGFGISPPYLINDRLVPGAHYEQKISLSRSNPEEDLKVQVSIDAPEIEKWLTVEPGRDFLFPKGEKLTSMTLKVDVPKKADLKNYKGFIRVRVIPVEAIEKGQVAVALGARIDVDLTVVSGYISDFLVRAINILNSERKPWPLLLARLNKIEVTLRIENTGNIESSPTKVNLEIYDSNGKQLLQSSDDLKLKIIKPFETEEIVADFPTKLLAGSYLGKVKVFNEEQIIREEKMIFSIKDIPFSNKDWMIFISGAAIILIILAFVFYLGSRFLKKKKETRAFN